MQSAKNIFLSLLMLLLIVPVTQAATTLCLEWEVPQGKKLPDFDITLVLGRKRVLYPPNNSTLKIGNSIAAIHDKTSPTDQECITLVSPKELSEYTLGIHHYSKDATDLTFLELYELKKNGTAKVIGNYSEHFENNREGNASATPRARSGHWVLIKVSDIMAALAPAPATKTEPKQAAVVEKKVETPDCDPGERKDLRHCNFANKFLHNVSFKWSDVSGVSFKDARLEGAMFNDAKCAKADFVNTQLKDASFVRAKCSHADFAKADLRDVNFKDADLTKAKFRKADIRRANFKRARLRGANYKEAKRSKGANFTDIKK